MGNTDNMVEKALTEIKKTLKNPKNQQTAIAAAGAYLISKTNKERNALAAGLLAYMLLPDPKDNDEEAED